MIVLFLLSWILSGTVAFILLLRQTNDVTIGGLIFCIVAGGISGYVGAISVAFVSVLFYLPWPLPWLNRVVFKRVYPKNHQTLISYLENPHSTKLP